MAGETAVETPVAPPTTDNKVEDTTPAKSDKEAIVEEEKAAEAAEEKKDAEKKEEKPAKKEVEKPKRFPVRKQDFEQDTVYLYQFFRTPTLPSVSPFCIKVESWLKLHGIKYENVDHKVKYRSKRGMLPFVELNGEEIGDSNTIIEVLSKKFEKEMPAQLTAEQKNVQHAMVAMVENHFHWIFTQWKVRDMNHMLKGFKVDLATAIGSKVPPAILNFYFKHTFLRKGMKKVKAQGFGANTNEEIEQFGKNDMLVLSEMLGDKEFFFGDEPAFLDLVVFSHLAQVAFVDKEVACSFRDYMESDCKNLLGLVNRMKDRCWADHWDHATGEEMDWNPHIPKPTPPEPVEEKKEEEEEKKEEKEKETAKEEKKEEEKEKADEKKEEEKEKENEKDAEKEKEVEEKKDESKKEEKK